LIQEVSDNEDSSEDEDTEMADASKSNGHDSDSISTVSKDTLSPPSLPAWESSILGNTIEPKKSRKNERDLQNVSWANLKSPK